MFGLCSQMKSCAVSIPSNIAEGQGRATAKEFIRFLSIARGSCNELETQLIISNKQSFVSDTDFQQTSSQCEEVNRLISGLIKYYQRQQNKNIIQTNL